MMMTLGDAERLVPGSRRIGAESLQIERVHTDTRSLQRGDLFVALKGDRFDAHDFLASAASAGAVAAMASRGLGDDAHGHAHPLPGLLVADTQAALTSLATAWRRRHDLPVVAVAGSNGKTTVTQMVGSILRAWLGEAALVTRGNLNNHIGVPLSVLSLRAGTALTHRAAVFELGMNHPGEIAQLAAVAQPTVAVVNNAQREHQEFMHSVDAVARENGAVLEALPVNGTAVFPADDAYAAMWRAMAGQRRVWSFALHVGTAAGPDAAAGSAAATVTGQATWQSACSDQEAHWAIVISTPAGKVNTLLTLPGMHNVRNAMAAATAALAAGAPVTAVAEGLASFRAVKGRSQLSRWQRGNQTVTLVDDSYNANPDSVRAAIDLLAALPGPHWLVMGDMGEVGTQGPEMHAEVGRHAAAAGIAQVWCVGTAMRDAATACGPTARWFADAPAAIAALDTEDRGAPACASALVKGSRFMGMERFVAALQATGEAA